MFLKDCAHDRVERASFHQNLGDLGVIPSVQKGEDGLMEALNGAP